MRRIHVAVINRSNLSDERVAHSILALQKQIDMDFAPAWGIQAKLSVETDPPSGYWWLVYLNDSDQAGALGYHDLTDELHPLGKVFVETDRQNGVKPSVTASHELCEMLGDPHVNLTALDPRSARLYAYESADAVEADNLGYEIGGVAVSNFVYPEYFDPRAKGKHLKLDQRGVLEEPFQIAPGGYLSYIDLRAVNNGWQQVTAEKGEGAERPEGFPPGSRRERRRRLGELRASDPHRKERSWSLR